jgi:hypothetical protein
MPTGGCDVQAPQAQGCASPDRSFGRFSGIRTAWFPPTARPDVREGGWERIVEMAYEGHGG